MKIIAIYPGRFQPFGKHHAKAFEWLQNKFGKQNTFVATSNVTGNDKSPFDFNLKKRIIEKYGIPPSNIVQVKDPYKSLEVVSKFDPENTAVVFMYGEKDAGRISYIKKDGSPGYLQKYIPGQDLEPISKRGYIIVAPHVFLNVGKTEMSGTSLREALRMSSPEQFKEIMGWYDPSIYNEIKTILNPLTKEGWKSFFNLVEVNKKKVITEGGAAGHLQHPFENSSNTFNDLKQIIARALTGKLNIEKDVTEKTDGQNLMVTFVDGKVLAARNKSTIKEPMTIQQISQKFEGRGPIKDAFVYSMMDLQKALQKLPKEKSLEFFNNGKNFVNLEILFPPTKNIIDYGKDSFYLQFHNIVEFDENGNAVSTREAGSDLQKAIASVNADVQGKFKIIPPQTVELEEIPNLKEKLGSFLKRLKSIQSEFNLSDSDTIQDYYSAWWDNYIQQNFDIEDESIRKGLSDRWSGVSKKFLLNGKNIPDENLLEKLKSFDSSKAPKIQKDNFEKFEDLILEVGAEVMINAANLLSLRNPDSKSALKRDLDRTISQIKKDPSNFSAIQPLLRKIENMGGFEKIVPSEGIVFYYKGKPYKLTGGFTPVHRILSKVLYAESVLKEGGWVSTKTQGIKLTPQVVKKTIVVFERFVEELNKWLDKKGLEGIVAVKPIGSTAYYRKDLEQNPENEYGDIDYLVEFPETETPSFWKKKVVEFIKSKSIPYVDEDSEKAQGNSVILEVEPGMFIQVDLISSTKTTSRFAAGRFTPEYGLKGFTIGNLYSSFASALNVSISDSGVIARFKGGKLAPSNLRSGVEKVVVSLDLDNFLVDLCNFLATKSGLTIKSIDPKLKQFSGVNPDNPSIGDFAQGIVGFCKTLESNGILGGPLFPDVTTAKELVSTIREMYLEKNKQASQGSKFDKAQSDSAFKAIEKIKKHAEKASGIVNTNLKVERIIKEGGNIGNTNSFIPRENVDPTIENAFKSMGIDKKDWYYQIVGNVQKPYSGDIDIAVDENSLLHYFGVESIEEFWKEIKKFLDGKNLENEVNKGLEQFHLVVPVLDKSGKQIKQITDREGTQGTEPALGQIDFMVGDMGWMKDFLTGSPKKYKDSYKVLLFTSVLANIIMDTKNPEVKRKLQIIAKRGVQVVDFTVDEKGKRKKLKVINLTNDMQKLINFLFKGTRKVSELKSFEDLWDAINSKDFKYPDLVSEILNTFKSTLTSLKMPFPEEIS